MNKEDIIRLAGEAGLVLDEAVEPSDAMASRLLRFAELVGAQEREACARACESVEESHNLAASAYWDLYMPTDCEDAASRGASECARAIRHRKETGSPTVATAQLVGEF